MKELKTALALVATTIAVAAMPASAGAEYLVPPGNSAAIQYTETYPTAGGHKNAEDRAKRSPSQVLGGATTRRLEQHGPDGEAVAEVVAETAPPAYSAPEEGFESSDENGSPEGQAATGNDKGGSGGAGPQPDAKPSGDRATSPNAGAGDIDVSGSSGPGEVLAQAFGVSSTSLLLPLAILGGFAWALVYLLRQRKRQAA